MALYSVLLLPDSERGGYTVEVPTLPGVVTEGEARAAALANARDAIALLIEDLRADGEPVPQELERPELVEVEVEMHEPVAHLTA